jgi:hypothetical protein
MAVSSLSMPAQDAPRSPGWVVIPVRDYDALRGKAFSAEPAPDLLQARATLTRVDYDLRVEGSVAAGRANLTVDVLSDGWVKAPIPQGLLVREARVGGELVSLVPTPGRPGQLSALLSSRGRSVLVLDVAFAIVSSGGEERLWLPSGTSGITSATVVPAGPDVQVNVSGGVLQESSAARWLAYARGPEPLGFTWRKKIEERRVELPVRMRASITQLFGVGEDGSSLAAEVELEVQQGTATELRLQVPDALTVNQVPGANVADWDVRNGELQIHFLDPVERSTKFVIQAEARLPREGSMTIPLLRVLDVERESGGVAVEVLGAGEIKATRAQGLDAADAAELGTAVAARQSPSLSAFRLRAGAAVRSLNLDVARYTQQAVLTANIEEARYRVLLTAEGKTLVQARYAVRNNQRNFVGITLPPGASVWSSSLAGQPVRPGQAPGGGLLFPLAKGRAGDEAPPFAIEILYSLRTTAWMEKGHASLALPVLDLPVSRTGLVLYFPPLYRLTIDPGAFRMQAYEAPASEVLNVAPVFAGTAIRVSGAPAQASTQALIDEYRNRAGNRRGAEALPARVTFPSVGPTVFLVSELTGEGQGAVLEFGYQNDKKGGVR